MNTIDIVIEDLGGQLAAKAVECAVLKARAFSAEEALAEALARLAELEPAEQEEGTTEDEPEGE